MCTQIWESYNFLSCIVFTDEAKFQISVHVSWHNSIILGSEPLREHSERDWDSPKMNMWCGPTHEEVTGSFFFDEDIITSSLFLDLLENYGPPQLNENSDLILELEVAPVQFAHIVHDC
jgi:hypothetical protein